MKKKIVIAVVLSLCCVMVLSGCAMEEAIDNMLYDAGYAASEPADLTDAYDGGTSFPDLTYDSYKNDWAAEAPVELEDGSLDFSAEIPSEYAEVVPDKADDLIAGATTVQDGSKLVQTRSITMRSTEFDKDYAKIKTLLKNAGGYIEHESLSGTAPESVYDKGRDSYIVMRVPVDKYDAFVEDISGIGTIESMQVDTQDYSDTYYDTESRIELLEERKARLMGHLAEAKKMEDIITLEDEISDVIYQLDQLKGQQRGIDNMVEYATVSLEIYEYQLADDAVISDDVTLDPGNAFNNTLKGMGEFFRVFGVMLAAAAPVLILIGIVLAVVLIIVKVVNNARKKKATTEIK